MTYYNVGKIVNTQGLQGELRVLSVTDFAEENLTDLGDGEFYYHEIIGLDVYEGDTLIGQVKEILQPGANDVWVVKRKGKKDLLLPYIPPVVLDVDVVAGRIEVELMEGLDDED